MIDFQKSRASNKDAGSFTINIGVCSTTIRKFLTGTSIDVKPTIEDSHWNERIGFLLPERKDYWWQMDSSTDLARLATEITNLLELYVILASDGHISDRNLEDCWLAGDFGGVTELQRFKYLTILLKAGKNSNYNQVADEFMAFAQKKDFVEIAREHLKELSKISH